MACRELTKEHVSLEIHALVTTSTDYKRSLHKLKKRVISSELLKPQERSSQLSLTFHYAISQDTLVDMMINEAYYRFQMLPKDKTYDHNQTTNKPRKHRCPDRWACSRSSPRS